jgi:hypothetical protein
MNDLLAKLEEKLRGDECVLEVWQDEKDDVICAALTNGKMVCGSTPESSLETVLTKLLND